MAKTAQAPEFLTTRAASVLLAQLGIHLSPRSLEAMRSAHTGPRFTRAGIGPRSRCFYTEQWIREWLEARASEAA